jgi:hypothetical protein
VRRETKETKEVPATVIPAKAGIHFDFSAITEAHA